MQCKDVVSKEASTGHTVMHQGTVSCCTDLTLIEPGEVVKIFRVNYPEDAKVSDEQAERACEVSEVHPLVRDVLQGDQGGREQGDEDSNAPQGDQGGQG